MQPIIAVSLNKNLPMWREDRGTKNVSTASSEKEKNLQQPMLLLSEKKRCFCQIRNQEHIPH